MFDVFFGCLLEGLLEGFWSQNCAQTNKITQQMGPKEVHRALQKGKDFIRKTTENNFLNKNAAKAEL